jgi:hypothetical protein
MTDDQAEQLLAILASVSESLRILCEAVDRAAGNDEEG